MTMCRLQCAVALLAMSAVSALADAGDPPSRVARLNYESGTVSFRPGSVEEWAPATLNYPLTSGDHLWADEGAQAEMHIGSTAIRMDSQTALAILNLDDRIVQLSLTQGTLNVHIRYLGENETFEVDTPNVAISLLRAGDYRIRADGDNAITIATVRGGEAEATGGGAAFPIHPGQSARITGTDPVSQDIEGAPLADGFDRWCQARERREESSVSARYVPREMIGYEDLDQYGVWRNVAPYGWVWTPTGVVGGWAPYHYGRWAWVEPWGWTWIDDAPWGFAPFHYGRWAFVSGMWVWAPGRMMVSAVAVRPVYAPALVAFVGGARFSVGLAVGGGGGVAAWFPLGPGEVYRPAYHVSTTYVQQVNITHVTNVTNITNVNVTNVRYVNQNVQGAVTAVPQQAFVGARPVHEAAIRLPPGAAAAAEVVGSTAQVAPERQSVLGRAGQGGTAAAPPARLAQRQVVARSTPPPPPVSFDSKRAALTANHGQPLDPADESRLRTSAPPRAPMVRTVGRTDPSSAVKTTGNGVGAAAQPDRKNAPVRNDRPPAAVTPSARPVERNTEAARPAEAQHASPPRDERNKVTKTDKKPAKKTDKRENR